MKTKIIFITCFFFAITCFIPANGQKISKEEASVIAQNWINIIIDQYGMWGDSKTASPEPMQILEQNGKQVGFFCSVNPHGFIVTSIRKELAPIKAYSAKNNIDKDSDEGISRLIKDCMEKIIIQIENQKESIETIQTEDLIEILEINYLPYWDNIYQYVSGTYKLKSPKSLSKDSYQEGDILLTSNWHQTEPYNDQCPNLGCSWPCSSNTNALVGCVATAGAQIARYWNWPPYGEGSPYNDAYDWINMPDEFTGCTWTAAEVNATAELNAEVGQAVGMSYGCGASGAYTWDMENVFEDQYRYSTVCGKADRDNYSAIDWFNRLKYQFNLNRPVQYRIPGHSIVGDGWQEIGSPVVRQYHMNYGWTGSSADTWYTLDALQGGDPSEEYIIEFIYPAQALGPFVSGNFYEASFPYRYVDQDCQGGLANFYQGQFIQFLEGMKIMGTSASDYIKFYGISTDNTILYSGGNTSRGMRILNGSIRLQNNGSIKMY